MLLAVGYIVSFKSTSFIKDLVICMNEVKKKNYDVKMPHYSNSAVDALGMYFNDMTAAMKTLINDTYKAKIMRQEMELEFIQQQMNPIFCLMSFPQFKSKRKCAEMRLFIRCWLLFPVCSGPACIGKKYDDLVVRGGAIRGVLPISAKAEVPGPARLSYSMEPGLERVVFPGSPLNRIVENLCFMNGRRYRKGLC